MPTGIMQADQILNVWIKVYYKTDIHENHSHILQGHTC